MDLGKSHQLGLSFQAEAFTHFGSAVHYSWIFSNRAVWVEKKKKSFYRNHQFLLSAHLGFYEHPRNHVALKHLVGLHYRRSKLDKIYAQLGVQTGLVQKFLDAPTFEVSEQGIVEQITLPSRSQWAFGIHTQLGRFFELNSGHKLGWYLASNTLYAIPHGSGGILYSTLQAGISIQLK